MLFIKNELRVSFVLVLFPALFGQPVDGIDSARTMLAALEQCLLCFWQ